MAITAGIRSGIRNGIRSGIDPADVSWSTDATSGKGTPASGAEWEAMIASEAISITAPSSLWLAQEASGNLADSIGALTLTANGSPAYQQSVAGWTRKGVKGDAVTASQRFRNAAAPNPSITSMAMFAYVYLGAQSASVLSIMGFGATSDASIGTYQNAAPSVARFRYRESANIADTGTGNDYTGRVTPIMILVDHGGARARLYTDLEKVSPTYGLPSTTTAIWLGADSGTWADSTILYACAWSGVDAEMSDAAAKALFTALGYSILWS